MPVPGFIKRITNPEDDSQYVDVRVINELSIKHGKGHIFTRRINDYNNQADSSRIVESRRVTHQAIDENGNPVAGDDDDESQYVDVEDILEFSLRHGKGAIYQKHLVNLNNDPEIESVRQTHTVRITNPDDEDVWVDIERIDQVVLRHGKGAIFRREIIDLIWDDDAFDSTDGLDTVEGPGDGYDPPWRIDPFQKIVNVSWAFKPRRFVAGTMANRNNPDSGALARRYMSTDGVIWENVGTGGFSPTPPELVNEFQARMNWACYDRKHRVYLMIGTRPQYTGITTVDLDIIERSEDGVNWSSSSQAGLPTFAEMGGFGGYGRLHYDHSKKAIYLTLVIDNFFGTDELRYYKSTDGGESWSLHHSDISNTAVVDKSFFDGVEYAVSGSLRPSLSSEERISVRVKVNISTTGGDELGDTFSISVNGGPYQISDPGSHIMGFALAKGVLVVACMEDVNGLASGASIRYTRNGTTWHIASTWEGYIFALGFASGKFVAAGGNAADFEVALGSTRIDTSSNGVDWETTLNEPVAGFGRSPVKAFAVGR